MGDYKYKLQKGNGTMWTPRDLNWFEKLRYRLKGYTIIKLS